MQHNTLLTLLIAVFISNFSFAQNIDDIAKKASDGLCTCVNKTYSNIDEDVKHAMVEIIHYQMKGQQKEMEDYAKALPADLTSRIGEQAVQFTENQEMFDQCVEEVQLSLLEYTLDNDTEISEEQFVELMMAEMKDTRSCKFAYLLMKLGLSEQNNDNKSNNGQINGGGGKNDNKSNNNSNNSSGGDQNGTGGN